MIRTLPVGSRNQWFQRVDALGRNRKKRSREGAFLVEGVRSISQLATRSEWRVEAYLYAAGPVLSEWAQGILESSTAQVHLRVAPDLMAELSDKDDPSEMLAVVSMPDDDPARLGPVRDRTFVLLERPSRPGNVGSVLRSCDALGVAGVVIFGRAADPYDPRSVRGAAGSLFSVPVVRIPDWGSLRSWIDGMRAEASGVRIVGTSADGPVDLADERLLPPAVLVFGGETRGMSRGLRELCDAVVRIPMTGTASSLNLASAVTVTLYEADRQRRGRSHGP